MIRKRIAAGLPDVGISSVGEICSLKRFNAFVCQIGCVDFISDIFLGGNSVKAVLKEEFSTQTVGEILGEVVLHDIAYRSAA